MKELKKSVQEQNALSRPAETNDIDALQNALGFTLTDEYRTYLSTFGVIAHGAYETYGLGVKQSSHLHVSNIYQDLSSDESYPLGTVPIIELGDGQYYLYDNLAQQVLLWATPNGGLVKRLNYNLEQFLIEHLFKHNDT